MKIQLTDHQADFLVSEKKFCGLVAGIGSGKSHIGSIYVRKKLGDEPNVLGFIGANTYRQLNNATLASVFTLFDSLNLKYKYNQNKGILSVGGTDIICGSLDNYNPYRGIEIGWWWLDEGRDTDVEAFKVLMGRLRHKRAKRLEGRVTTSPDGFNWIYDYFAGEKKTHEFELIEATSMDNPFLPDGYIQTLEQSYDQKVFQQEVLGKFVNINLGSIYYAFKRSDHLDRLCTLNRSYPLYAGIDFNINPITAVIGQFYDNKAHIVDEIYIMSSDTHELGELIKEKYSTQTILIPDATGKALKTSSRGLSDHQILRNIGFQIKNSGNPFRADRYNCVNNLFAKSRLRINPKCKNLVNDLEKVTYKEGTNLPNTSQDSTLTHISDALGYLCWYFDPIVKPYSPVQMIGR